MRYLTDRKRVDGLGSAKTWYRAFLGDENQLCCSLAARSTVCVYVRGDAWQAP